MVAKQDMKKPTVSRQKFFAIVVLAAIFLIILFFLIIDKQSSHKIVDSEIEESTFLYVQNAESGSLLLSTGDEWTLTLYNVSPSTVYFSDRPARETGHESTENFVANWNEGENSFAVNPPNAALDIIGQNGEQNVLVVELMAASYNTETNTLTYELIILDDEPIDTTAYTSFGTSALFIDSTYKHYNCKCDIPSGKYTCECKYTYNLRPSTTKEFRMTCYGGDDHVNDIHITNRRDDTTCTTEMDVDDDFTSYSYISKSCTNWNTKANDHLTVKIECN